MSPEQITLLANDRGFNVVNDTTTTIPDLGHVWTGFLVRTTATFTKFECAGVSAADAAKFISLPCPAGTIIPGIITLVQLSAGDIILFKGLAQ